MKRRGFLAALLSASVMPVLGAPDPRRFIDLSDVRPVGEALTFDIETSRGLAIDAISQENALFSFAFNTGRVVYAFPDHPVIPTKIARFCDGRD